jgi:hypothetical protein
VRLVNARLCLDCEELHELDHCPICGSETFAFVTRWVKPSEADSHETSSAKEARPPDSVARREQVDAYRQILDPTPPPRRNRLLTSGALGLAILGLARLALRAAPDAKVAKAKKDGN